MHMLDVTAWLTSDVADVPALFLTGERFGFPEDDWSDAHAVLEGGDRGHLQGRRPLTARLCGAVEGRCYQLPVRLS